jgi:DNA-binding NtrC family response regulator/tetratricopeptide (TPR) repeat protein
MTHRLFADRFVVTRPDAAIDLATGEPVWLRMLSFVEPRCRERWLRRCAALSRFAHPHLVGLADYGPVSASTDFEAWRCAPPPHAPWRGRRSSPRLAVDDANAALRSHGLDIVPVGPSTLLDVGGRPTIWPGEEPAPARERTDGQAAAPREGVSELETLAQRLEEVLDGGLSGRPRSVHLTLRHSRHLPLASLVLARSARLRGYVPVSWRLLDPEQAGPRGWRDTIEGRHVVVLCDDAGADVRSRCALFFLGIALASDRPHVLLWLVPSAARETIPVRPSRSWRVAEESVPYSPDAVIAQWTPALVPGRRRPEAAAPWPSERAGAGRHAHLERWLRDAEGRAARRGDAAGAGEAVLALGRLCLWRGRVAEALRAFDGARLHFERAGLGPRVVFAGALAGLALTDDARFADAESALRAACIAAGTLHDRSAGRLARIGLARCLVWQGRFDEAFECLESASPAGELESDETRLPEAVGWRGGGVLAQPRRGSAVARLREAPAPFGDGWAIGTVDALVAQACLAGRAALGMGDLAAAGRSSAAARERAAITGTPTDVAVACRTRAMLFRALGDLPAAREQVEQGLEAARRAHDPLRAIRLRLVLAEALVDERRSSEARHVLARLGRLDIQRLPPIVGRALQEVLKRGPDSGRGPSIAGGGPGARRRAEGAGRSRVADAIVEILAVCEAAEDEASSLRTIAGILRQRLRAAVVGCAVIDDGHPVVLAHEGVGRTPEGVAERAIDLGLDVPPSSSATGLEAAVPIRAAGRTIGAWTCRWAADQAPNWDHASDLLAAAAAAVAATVHAVVERRAQPSPDRSIAEIIGISAALRSLREAILHAAPTPFNVVIEGESGSGKELVARAIHRLGPRAKRPLCPLNCAALTDDLLEAELFGHARGAFTGAVAERRGLFEEAHQGTLVLDEVGELTPRAQAKLLRAIQEGEVRRLGENHPRAVDVRIVAATNRPLRDAVEAGAFRADLLYRLEVIRIVVAPLRERVEDIPILAAHFWHQAAARVGSRCSLSAATVAALARYQWPGNVRELQNVMAALAVGAGRRGSLGPDRLPAAIRADGLGGDDTRNLDAARRQFEAGFVRAALARAGGRRAQAAEELGVTRQGLAKLLARLKVE